MPSASYQVTIQCAWTNCDYKTDQPPSRLHRHELLCHAEWFFRPFLCTVCDRGYDCWRHLDTHMSGQQHQQKVDDGAVSQSHAQVAVTRQECLARVKNVAWRDKLKLWSRAPFTTELDEPPAEKTYDDGQQLLTRRDQQNSQSRYEPQHSQSRNNLQQPPSPHG